MRRALPLTALLLSAACTRVPELPEVRVYVSPDPLRPGVPVPPGVEPAGNLLALPLEWDARAAEVGARAGPLSAWPAGFTQGDGPPR